MDDNPYASPEIARGFREALDRPATAKSTLDGVLQKKETRRIVELTGAGYAGLVVFLVIFGVGTFWTTPLTPGPQLRPIVLLAGFAATIVTHVGSIRYFAHHRLRKMHTVYRLQPGDPFELEILPGVVRLRSEEAEFEWDMHCVDAIWGRDLLTFVADDLLTIPIAATADFGGLDLPAFTALYKEQQRRYRATRPWKERLQRVFRGGGWV